MAVEIITVEDIPQSVKDQIGDPDLVQLMVDGLNAKAARIAPCLASTTPPPTPEQLAEAKLILIGTIRRWAEAGTGAFQQQAAGPFSVSTDTRQRAGWNMWPSDIEALQDLCAGDTSGDGKAFAVDTVPTSGYPYIHAQICALNFGADYCSCGAILAGVPLWEKDDA